MPGDSRLPIDAPKRSLRRQVHERPNGFVCYEKQSARYWVTLVIAVNLLGLGA